MIRKKNGFVPIWGAVDNFKDGLEDTEYDLSMGSPVNVKNIILWNEETHRMMKYHGTQSGDVLTSQQLSEHDYVAWAHVQWPHEGWVKFDRLQKISNESQILFQPIR